MEFVTHTIRATLDEHPDWVDVSTDIRNAFNSIHRRAFMSVIAERFPGLWRWIYSGYGSPTELYIRRDAGPPEIVFSRCGTRQGDPLGAQLFALGLHPVLCAIQSAIGDRGVVVAYADDIHILAPPSVVAEIFPSIAARDPPPPPPAPALPPPSRRLWSIGLALAPGKGTIYSPSLSDPACRPAITATLRCVTDILGDPRLDSDARSLAILRGEGSSVASGHPVLGTPVGTPAFEQSVVQTSLDSTLRLLDRLRFILTSQQGTTVFAPDEFDTLVRFCIWSRPRHFMRTLPPGPITALLDACQHRILAAHLESIPATSVAAAPDISPHRLSELPGRFGGHGMMPYGAEASQASDHDAGWYGGWAAVWHYIRAWVPHLRGRQLAHQGPGDGYAYQASLAASWDRIARAHTAVGLHHDSSSLLPVDSLFPTMHSRFDEGRLSPATVPLGQALASDLDADSDEPSVIYDLDCLDAACHPHAHRAASAVVASQAFLALYDASSPPGRARLLDGSTARGPFSFWRRVPTPPEQSESGPSPVPLFSFSDPREFAVALALDLLIVPPVRSSDHSPFGAGVTYCARCAPSVDDPAMCTIGPHSRHFVTCGHGIRLSGTCHDPAVFVLGRLFSAVLGATHVITDGGPGHDAAMRAFMQTAGADLAHTPDLVLHGFDGPRTHTLVEVKTFDPAGHSRIHSSHTDRERGLAHVHAVRDSRRDDYRLGQGVGHRQLPRGMRLVVITVSTFGAIGTSGRALLSELGRRSAQRVPSSFHPEVSWAAPQLAPFARMAVTFAVRQGLAHSVMQSWDRAASVPSAPPRPVAADLPRPASAAPFGLPLPIGAPGPAGPLRFAGLPLPGGFAAPLALVAAGMFGPAASAPPAPPCAPIG